MMSEEFQAHSLWSGNSGPGGHNVDSAVSSMIDIESWVLASTHEHPADPAIESWGAGHAKNPSWGAEVSMDDAEEVEAEDHFADAMESDTDGLVPPDKVMDSTGRDSERNHTPKPKPGPNIGHMVSPALLALQLQS